MGHTQEGIRVAVVSREGRVCKEEGEEPPARTRLLLGSIGSRELGWPVRRQRTTSTNMRVSSYFIV